MVNGHANRELALSLHGNTDVSLGTASDDLVLTNSYANRLCVGIHVRLASER